MTQNWFETPLGQAILKERQNRIIQRVRAPSRTMQQRMYHSARHSRLTAGWTSANSSADAELVSSLQMLRSRSRALVRDSSYAKRAKTIVVNNIIGTGIGMQAQVKTTRDTLNTGVNDEIEELWEDHSGAESYHTGGRLSAKHFDRALMGQTFEAGEVLVRKYFEPFGRSKVPYALELIEAERIADDLTLTSVTTRNGNQIRMGIELDRFYRPVAYYIRRRHPSEVRWTGDSVDEIERVPAEFIYHLAVVDRWPQTRGEPWLHTAVRRLNDMDGYTEAEVVRARAQAVRMGIIETPNDAMSFGETQDDGSVEMELESGIVTRLNPGEEWKDSAPSAPNPNLDGFMRYMVREIAAGCGPSYESISRDYSQSNYSSSRLALLDDRDLWRFFQSWFICDFRHRVHKEWLQQAVLSGATKSISTEQYMANPRKFEAVLFKPRGWSWIDPTKEVEAYKEAIRAGLTTRTDVIAATAGGQDIEDVDDTRARELMVSQEKGLKFDTDPDYYMSDAAKAKAEAKAAAKLAKPPAADENTEQDENSDPPPKRVVSLVRP